MFSTGRYREKAAEYAELAKNAGTRKQMLEFLGLEQTFTALANNEQWLNDNYDQMVHPRTDATETEPASDSSALDLAVEEEQILRYLGAALIMQWSTLPQKLQRELFDTAGSMGDLLKTTELRGHIARFLHKHHNDSPQRPPA
jgi:hypothetical protein